MPGIEKSDIEPGGKHYKLLLEFMSAMQKGTEISVIGPIIFRRIPGYHGSAAISTSTSG
jgi:hypothetical protein